MLNLIRRMIDPVYRSQQRAMKTYHDSPNACRVLCEMGHAGFVHVLRRRLDDLLAEYPMEAAVESAADAFHEALRRTTSTGKRNEPKRT